MENRLELGNSKIDTNELSYDYVFHFEEHFGKKERKNDCCVRKTAVADGDIEEKEVNRKMERKSVFERLVKAGLTVTQHPSVSGEDLFLLIGATEERLRDQAERMQMELEVKSKYGGGYDVFKKAIARRFVEYANNSLFRSSIRQHLIYSIIQSPQIEGGANIGRSWNILCNIRCGNICSKGNNYKNISCPYGGECNNEIRLEEIVFQIQQNQRAPTVFWRISFHVLCLLEFLHKMASLCRNYWSYCIHWDVSKAFFSLKN